MSAGFITPEWPAHARVRALVTTREGGVSVAPYDGFNLGTHVGDAPSAVAANRAQLASLLPAAPKWLEQVHGVRVVEAAGLVEVPCADAAVTREAGVVCAVMTADCLPVLLSARDGSVVGIAHAGWRGLAAGVIESTIAAMNTPPQSLIAWLGPAIGPTAFEVGEDVRAAFVAIDPASEADFTAAGQGKWFADIFALARRRLARAGVAQVFGGGLCTFTDAKRFYSYRRDRVTGRMASLIWLAD